MVNCPAGPTHPPPWTSRWGGGCQECFQWIHCNWSWYFWLLQSNSCNKYWSGSFNPQNDQRNIPSCPKPAYLVGSRSAGTASIKHQTGNDPPYHFPLQPLIGTTWSGTSQQINRVIQCRSCLIMIFCCTAIAYVDRLIEYSSRICRIYANINRP